MKKMIKMCIIASFLIIIAVILINIFLSNKKSSVIDKNEIIWQADSLKCTVFDGKNISGTATISIKNGKIVNEIILTQNDNSDTNYFLMPGLIDAHTHITSEKQIEQMLNNGVTSTYDVAASKELANSVSTFDIWTALTTLTPGGVSNGRATASSLISHGADYIKVMVDMPEIMGGGLMKKEILQDMVSSAHENNMKVAAHATTIDGVTRAVETGVDILIHVPIGETFPEELAKQIADKNIAVIPTLVMMKAFANSAMYGFEKSDYQDAENAVKLLNSYGVPILVGTDANNSFFVPDIEHGSSLHKEMDLLVKAGLTPTEVLQGVTGKTVEAFELKNDNNNQAMLLIEGRPDQNITDTTKIRQIWIDGEPMLTFEKTDENIKKNDAKNDNKIND